MREVLTSTDPDNFLRIELETRASGKLSLMLHAAEYEGAWATLSLDDAKKLRAALDQFIGEA